MIFFALCVLCVIIAIALSITCIIFKPRNSYMPGIIAASWSAAIALTAAYVVASSAVTQHCQDLQQTYNELMLYYDTVAMSTDENIRFDYYTKVKDYNELYQDYKADLNSIWISSLYDKEIIDSITPIDFILNAG